MDYQCYNVLILFPNQLMFDESGSNSDENIDFKGLIKKVDYQGEILDSEQEQSESHEVKKKVRRKNYSKRISSLLEVEGGENDKTKSIKKNCISAKQSRQRKKIYIEALQKTAEQLKKQIINRKTRIASNRDAIMSAIKLTNPEKSRFISEYLQDNRNLAEQIAKVKPNVEKGEQKGQKIEQVPSKNDDKNLQNMINSYLFKFGFTGVLRRDVLEQLKMKWYELAIDQNIIMNGRHNELRAVLQKFKNCMNELQKKGLQLEYLFRNLQYNLSQQDIIKFIINPEFLFATQVSKIDLHQFKEQKQQFEKIEQNMEQN